MSSMSSAVKKTKIITKLLRDGKECAYCNISFKKLEDITLDHVVPRSQGGTNANNNLVLSCGKCNRKKNNMLLTQFMKAYDITVTKLLDEFL